LHSSDYAGLQVANSNGRSGMICGMRKKIFWIVLGLILLVILIAAVVGGVVGSVVGKHNKRYMASFVLFVDSVANQLLE